MEKLKTLLVANRGEIAVRIIRTAKKLGIRTIAIYSKADAASHHVSAADEPVLLPGSDSSAYTDGDSIIAIAKEKNADAIIPGYGFLSENGDFARAVSDAGIGWVGPSAKAIEEFGIKHVARRLAEKAGLPIVPGTKDLVADADAAVEAANDIGYPVMLKATGGGGGMGLVTCETEEQVREGFKTVTSRGEALFKNPGLFIEKFFPKSRHVEVQVFGNGQGKAIHFGERECSIQRRHQKVIEECPSPFVDRYEGLRQGLGRGAVELAQSINYGSAGTVELLLDNETGDTFFLEMNTRLQVEHGITELCYGVDLVEMMLQQADAELRGKGGLDAKYLDSVQAEHSSPKGYAIEARVYAENPIRDYAPSPGLLQKVDWADVQGGRIDTWVSTGSSISPFYDPLIAKVMYHSSSSRDDAIKGIHQMLSKSSLCGPPTNLDFLAAIVQDAEFQAGNTLTNFLSNFAVSPPAIDVIKAGTYTLVQDHPGRPQVGKGIPHSGAMDPVAFQIANTLVGNPKGTEGLEITLSGPELSFFCPAVLALCGAPVKADIDGQPVPMWTRIHIGAGQKLKIGKLTGGGCRAYLAIYGGLPGVADCFGSKSTSPLVAIGGYQGRALAPGDLLAITENIPEHLEEGASLPEKLIPKYTDEWEVLAMSGPHDEGYLLPEDEDMIYDTQWEVSHNANRSGIRLNGPVPKWARKDGGEGGSHPSNVVEYGYPICTLNWTGDDPCIFPVDCPNFGGFVSSTTTVHADWWKLGQLKAGSKMRYRRVTFDEAVAARKHVDAFIDAVGKAVKGELKFDDIQPLDTLSFAKSPDGAKSSKGIMDQIAESGNRPLVSYRQAGDSHLIVEYGSETFDLNHRCRVTELEKALYNASSTPSSVSDGIVTSVGCCTTLNIAFDPLKLDRAKLVEHLKYLESEMGDLSAAKLPTRKFRLPISFESKEQEEATKRYMETQRPYAPYLPDNLKFVAENNAFTPQQLKDIFLKGTLAAVVIGFYCGNTVSVPVDPRMRMNSPKLNPSRVHTPAGTVGWAGSSCSIYPVASPGGYQMLARTVPIFDLYGTKPGFSATRPWLFNDFDLLEFYPVSEAAMNAHLAAFDAGLWRFTWTDTEFDMAAHNALLRDTADEVRALRSTQRTAQDEMMRRDEADLRRWREEKEGEKVDPGTVEALMQRDDIEAVEAPVQANVWKVLVKEGDEVAVGQEIFILEAMKLEVSVKFGESGDDDDGNGGAPKGESGKKAVVEKVLVQQAETVKAGEKLALLRV